jgi:ABC-type multidrug transport system ATPase subunit
MMYNAIQTEKLTKRFRRVDALRGLDLEIPVGAIYALVGSNGAGKTTAIKVLMNILRPTSGRAEVLGIDSKRIAGSAFTDIGYVSENQELPGWMRVDSFLAYLRPFYPGWDTNLEKELVTLLELPLDRKLKTLSRGMKMKAALASSLAYRPKLIVLDEPFSGLDPLVRDQLTEGLLERAAEATVLISSHDLVEVESLASHVGYIEQGSLQFSEEMAVLTGRFRDVELILGEQAVIPQRYPATWIHLSASAAVVRFVESRFDPQETEAEIRSVFSSVRDATLAPMSLRAIFLAMAKAGRDPVVERTRL